MYYQTLIQTLIQIFLMIGLGYFLKKSNILSSENVDGLSRLLLSVILPFSVLTSGNEQCSAETIVSMLDTALIVSLYYIFSLIISLFVFRFKRKDDSLSGVSSTMAVFANTGFIGMPLAQILYGSEGLLFAVLYNLIYNLFMFTIGIKLMGPKTHKFRWQEIILDPLTLSSFLAVLLFLSPWKMPVFLIDVLSLVGNMTVPISMFIIGAWMVGVNWKSIVSRPQSYLVCFLRLVFFPLSLYFLLIPFDLNIKMVSTVVLLTALPIGSLNVIFAKKYNSDVAYVNETMLLSMVLSVVTIPAIMMIIYGGV